MPDDGNLSDEVANLRDGKIHSSTARIAPLQRLTEVIVFDFHRIQGQLLHHGLLIAILKQQDSQWSSASRNSTCGIIDLSRGMEHFSNLSFGVRSFQNAKVIRLLGQTRSRCDEGRREHGIGGTQVLVKVPALVREQEQVWAWWIMIINWLLVRTCLYENIINVHLKPMKWSL